MYSEFYENLGGKVIVGGDYNAKHTWWGSRLINPKGRELYKYLIKNKGINILTTGAPTYWPADPNKNPDLMDFVIFRGISSEVLSMSESFDLNSDHSALLLNYNSSFQQIINKYHVISHNTDKKLFQTFLDKHLNLKISLKNGSEIDTAVEDFTSLIHEASYFSTPKTCSVIIKNNEKISISEEIKELIKKKRNIRKIWQVTRYPSDKTKLNRISRKLKIMLLEEKNAATANFLKSLGLGKSCDYSLWKATKYLKRPKNKNMSFKDTANNWCRSPQSQADAFAKHLENTFIPFKLADNTQIQKIESFLESPNQMSLPLQKISQAEVELEIKKLKTTKSPGYDHICGKTAKLITSKGIKYLTQIFNSMLRLNHFPSQWKTAKIIMIHKAGKPETDINSFRPISLLATFSKVFEKILLSRVLPMLAKSNAIPEHQFGFRRHHGTPEQCHRVVNHIRHALESKNYCSAVFLDIQKAFDKVWHLGLLYKIKKILPAHIYLLLKSYLTDRLFYVDVKGEVSEFCIIKAGVPQGSVLGPTLYNIYTADMPTNGNTLIATYADDTALLSSHESADEASSILQLHLNEIDKWLNDWNIKASCEKSRHITFTLRKGDCPRVYLNNIDIPVGQTVKYLGLHIDRRLTWASHIKTKQQQLKLKARKLYWLIGKNSELSLQNKIILYKTVIKPIWTYGIQLWGTASESNIEILQRFQSKTLRLLVSAPWFVSNKNIHKDLNIPFVKDEINRFSTKYLDRLSYHTNLLAINLLDDSDEITRLKRQHVLDLPFRK